jgi:RimJ/RimL family protein N-acetyltransferase
MIIWPEIQPILQDGNLTLRPPAPEDAGIMYDYILGDVEISTFTTVPADYTMQMAHDAIERWTNGYAEKTVMQNAICLDEGQIIGQISLQSIDLRDHHAEIGYLLNAEYRGQGIMTRAISLLCDYAFGIGFRRLGAFAMPRNFGSVRALEKNGFEREAVLRNYITELDGTQSDAVLFSKIN